MKTGFWLKGGKGKLAGATVYQQNGETVMREVVAPSNPKTEKQTIQRIIMHTIMSAYSKLKDITDHSFEGQARGSATMAMFIKNNIGYARDKVATMQGQGVSFFDMYNFVPLGVRGYTPNQYLVSMGSLPQVVVEYPADEVGLNNSLLLPKLTQDDPTYQDICDQYNLKRGDQLTFLFVKNIDSRTQFGSNEFVYCRVILDPTNADFSQAPMSTPFIVDGAINLPSIRNENTEVFRFGKKSDVLPCVNFRTTDSAICVSGCVVVSRQLNSGDWLRSTTYMVYKPLGIVYSMGDCLNSAQNGTAIYAANEAYLNNAGVGGGQAAATGSNESGGTSGGGSNPEQQVSIAVEVDNRNLTAGTTLSFEEETLPTDMTVTASVTNAPAGAKIGIKTSSNAAAAILQEETIANGAADITISANAGTYYVFYAADGVSYVSTGYSFSVALSGGVDMG